VPLHPPRSLAPVKQLETLTKREATLRGIIKRNEPAPRLELAVQDMRHAQLAVLKARRALIEYEPDSIEKQRQLESIAADESIWSAASVTDILERYSPGRTPNTSLERTREG
jgi:hypothetical protein